MLEKFILDVMDDIFHPKEDTLKILCWYLNWKCVKKGGQEGGYLEDIEGF